MRVLLRIIAAVLAAAPAVTGTAAQPSPARSRDVAFAELQAHGVAHELRAITGAPHTPTTAMPEILRWTSAFLYEARIGE